MNVARSPQRLRPVDWQSVAPDSMAPLYLEESDRWSRLLDWDTTARWEDVERRRRLGLALGFAVSTRPGRSSAGATTRFVTAGCPSNPSMPRARPPGR